MGGRAGAIWFVQTIWKHVRNKFVILPTSDSPEIKIVPSQPQLQLAIETSQTPPLPFQNTNQSHIPRTL
jgi:hypothetical protein